mgnify:CR=1 FL=1
MLCERYFLGFIVGLNAPFGLAVAGCSGAAGVSAEGSATWSAAGCCGATRAAGSFTPKDGRAADFRGLYPEGLNFVFAGAAGI